MYRISHFPSQFVEPVVKDSLMGLFVFVLNPFSNQKKLEFPTKTIPEVKLQNQNVQISQLGFDYWLGELKQHEILHEFNNY